MCNKQKYYKYILNNSIIDKIINNNTCLPQDLR